MRLRIRKKAKKTKLRVTVGETLRHSLSYNSMEASYSISFDTDSVRMNKDMKRYEEIIRQRLKKRFQEQAQILVTLSNGK